MPKRRIKNDSAPEALVKIKESIFRDPVTSSFVILGFLLVVVGIFLTIPKKESQIRVIEEEKEVQSTEIFVDVSGAVLRPGVYLLTAGSRVSDAIAKAGGFSKDVDSEFVSKGINLAQKVPDGAKIYIPKKGENVQGTSVGSSQVGISGKININSASQSQLESLPAVGPVTAGKIIAGRPYASVEDLLSKKIVGQKTFEKIKGAISVF